VSIPVLMESPDPNSRIATVSKPTIQVVARTTTTQQ
jgi:hypothetical protein